MLVSTNSCTSRFTGRRLLFCCLMTALDRATDALKNHRDLIFMPVTWSRDLLHEAKTALMKQRPYSQYGPCMKSGDNKPPNNFWLKVEDSTVSKRERAREREGNKHMSTLWGVGQCGRGGDDNTDFQM